MTNVPAFFTPIRCKNIFRQLVIDRPLHFFFVNLFSPFFHFNLFSVGCFFFSLVNLKIYIRSVQFIYSLGAIEIPIQLEKLTFSINEENKNHTHTHICSVLNSMKWPQYRSYIDLSFEFHCNKYRHNRKRIVFPMKCTVQPSTVRIALAFV